MYVFENVFKPVKITREGFKKSVPILLNKKIKIPFQALEGSGLLFIQIRKLRIILVFFGYLIAGANLLSQGRPLGRRRRRASPFTASERRLKKYKGRDNPL